MKPSTYRLGEKYLQMIKQIKKGLDFQNIRAAHTAQYQENKQPNPKVGKRHKQTFLQRHTDG